MRLRPHCVCAEVTAKFGEGLQEHGFPFFARLQHSLIVIP